MSALEELEDEFSKIVASMPDEFDSHAFILKLAQANQRLYVLALSEYANNDQPFQTVHALIAKRLKNHVDLVRHDRDEPSKNIFGLESDAAVWQKV